MDDRWRFLYYGMTELRGHAWEVPPGMEGPGKAQPRQGGKTPCN